MSIKQKIVNKIIIRHPKLVTFAIGMAISLVMVAIFGLSDVKYAYATPFDIIGGPLHHLTLNSDHFSNINK